MQNTNGLAKANGCASCCLKVSRREKMFEVWDRENLVAFAKEANEKLREQDERIQQLEQDLKDAIKAYRELNNGS
jgi:tRNA(Phe) wybutosine-synthesizing methylase Tyw3